MKILVLETNPKERSLIQNALEKSGHEMLLGESAEQALRLLRAGETRFVIADDQFEDLRNSDLLKQMRTPGPQPVYLLILSSGEGDLAEADDTLHKPLGASELRARIMIGQRFLSLGDSLSHARDQIENLAVYDGLTGLMNRGAFYRTAQGELERARRSSTSLSLIALDLDNFKLLNEKYGLETGDEVLKVIAQTIREKSRPYDCIGRWTGDEFVIALPGVIGADAEKIAGRIIKGIQSTNISYEDNLLNVGVSVGIASASTISAATEVEPLIQQARLAMARAKEGGGNQINLTFV
jgi:diguanylate cyclase (GGDEF)-like protein